VSKDQGLGALLLIASVVGIVLYGWLVFMSEWSLLALQATGFIAVAGVLGIAAWIGYTMATAPPPQPLEDLRAESEVVEAEAVG